MTSKDPFVICSFDGFSPWSIFGTKDAPTRFRMWMLEDIGRILGETLYRFNTLAAKNGRPTLPTPNFSNQWFFKEVGHLILCCAFHLDYTPHDYYTNMLSREALTATHRSEAEEAAMVQGFRDIAEGKPSMFGGRTLEPLDLTTKAEPVVKALEKRTMGYFLMVFGLGSKEIKAMQTSRDHDAIRGACARLIVAYGQGERASKEAMDPELIQQLAFGSRSNSKTKPKTLK